MGATYKEEILTCKYFLFRKQDIESELCCFSDVSLLQRIIGFGILALLLDLLLARSTIQRSFCRSQDDKFSLKCRL